MDIETKLALEQAEVQRLELKVEASEVVVGLKIRLVDSEQVEYNAEFQKKLENQLKRLPKPPKHKVESSMVYAIIVFLIGLRLVFLIS